MATAEIDAKNIRQALAAHGAWKDRLSRAVATGVSDVTVDDVGADERCALGEWLHGLAPDVRHTHHWRTVHELHVAFHREAAVTLHLALEGEIAGAEPTMELGGAYQQASTELILALCNWLYALK
jgi:methyl-accepting chemotaxis protein